MQCDKFYAAFIIFPAEVNKVSPVSTTTATAMTMFDDVEINIFDVEKQKKLNMRIDPHPFYLVNYDATTNVATGLLASSHPQRYHRFAPLGRRAVRQPCQPDYRVQVDPIDAFDNLATYINFTHPVRFQTFTPKNFKNASVVLNKTGPQGGIIRNWKGNPGVGIEEASINRIKILHNQYWVSEERYTAEGIVYKKAEEGSEGSDGEDGSQGGNGKGPDKKGEKDGKEEDVRKSSNDKHQEDIRSANIQHETLRVTTSMSFAERVAESYMMTFEQGSLNNDDEEDDADFQIAFLLPITTPDDSPTDSPIIAF